MQTVRSLLVLGLCAATLCGQAAEPAIWATAPELAAAEPQPLPPAEDAAPNAPDGDVTGAQIIDEIHIDLIDLGRLRDAVESQTRRERMRLSLEECVQMALENNQELLNIEYEPLKAATDRMTAQGEFDPFFNITANYTRAIQSASPEYERFGGISNIVAHRTTSAANIAGKLTTGTMYDLRMDLSKEETTWNNMIEEYNGMLTLTVQQPLLKGRRCAVNRARIRMAEQAEEAAVEQLRLTVMNVVARVVKAYWDLVGAIESVKVSKESLANAERLLDISEKRLEIGTAAAIEVLQAKAGVAVRQSELIAARSRVGDAEDVLKQLLDLRDNDRFSYKQLIPVDRPDVDALDIDALPKLEDNVRESIELALEKRPEMRMQYIEIENARIEADRLSDALLPEFNLTASVAQGGRDHKARNVFKGMYDRTDNAHSFGFVGSLPLGNRAARGSHLRAELTHEQSEQRLNKTTQELMLQVRLASRALSTSQALVESNRQATRLQQTNVAAEEKRLKLGVTTSYRVLQIQEDLSAAQTQELQAEIAYAKALVELRLAEGTLLDSLGIPFETPEPRKPENYFKSVLPKEKDIPLVIKNSPRYVTEDIPRFFTEDVPEFFNEDLPEALGYKTSAEDETEDAGQAETPQDAAGDAAEHPAPESGE